MAGKFLFGEQKFYNLTAAVADRARFLASAGFGFEKPEALVGVDVGIYRSSRGGDPVRVPESECLASSGQVYGWAAVAALEIEKAALLADAQALVDESSSLSSRVEALSAENARLRRRLGALRLENEGLQQAAAERAAAFRFVAE